MSNSKQNDLDLICPKNKKPRLSSTGALNLNSLRLLFKCYGKLVGSVMP
jgi:hypothetical protein